MFGSSSTLNLEHLARGLEKDIQPGDEFIVTGEHESKQEAVNYQGNAGLIRTALEANVGPWKKLADRRGATVKYWQATPTSDDNPYSVSLKVDELIPHISEKTRIVAFTACSNILGSILPVKEIVKVTRDEAKAQGAEKVEISVDCVTYAPHRRIDVQDWDVDFCVFFFRDIPFT